MVKHLLSISDLSKKGIHRILEQAAKFDKEDNMFTPQYKNNSVVINAFFEPSTRTQLSFESAAYRIGANVISFNKDTSSARKGESDEDTIRTISSYGNLLVLRHPDNLFAEKISSQLSIPVINAGNGNGEHPTQALLDLYTIHKQFRHHFTQGSLIHVLIVGDIKHSRTIHSLIELLHNYENVKINLLPYSQRDPELSLLTKISNIHNQDISTIIVSKESCDLKRFDVVYMTRLQKEREDNGFTKEFIIDKSTMEKLKPESIVMHPLPRNDEISPDVDSDPRCVYFNQVKNGVYIRMALIQFLTNQYMPPEEIFDI
tara:strand:+ start:1012 stop:1959 length:948 start_codon:yes stop_codon:yes gene_type:complete